MSGKRNVTTRDEYGRCLIWVMANREAINGLPMRKIEEVAAKSGYNVSRGCLKTALKTVGVTWKHNPRRKGMQKRGTGNRAVARILRDLMIRLGEDNETDIEILRRIASGVPLNDAPATGDGDE